MQTWFDFERDVIDAAIDQWRDCLRSCVRVLLVDVMNTCSEMNVYLDDTKELFMNPSM